MNSHHTRHAPALTRIEALIAAVPADDLFACREQLLQSEASDNDWKSAHNAYKKALAAIRAAEGRQHQLRLADPTRTPMGGDAVRLIGEWTWGGLKSGAIGVLDGVVGVTKSPDDPVAITFNYSAFLGPSSAWSPDMPHCSCSGGPGTIATPSSELHRTDETIQIRFWRWKELPCAGGGEDYVLTVPLWEWRPRLHS